MQQEFGKILRQKFLEKKTRNAGYSLRAFARQLSVSPSALSEIMRNKRQISDRYVHKISSRLLLSPEEHKTVLRELRQKRKIKLSAEEIQYDLLEAEQHRVIAEWYHFAILSLIKTKNGSKVFPGNSIVELSPDGLASSASVTPQCP